MSFSSQFTRYSACFSSGGFEPLMNLLARHSCFFFHIVFSMTHGNRIIHWPIGRNTHNCVSAERKRSICAGHWHLFCLFVCLFVCLYYIIIFITLGSTPHIAILPQTMHVASYTGPTWGSFWKCVCRIVSHTSILCHLLGRYVMTADQVIAQVMCLSMICSTTPLLGRWWGLSRGVHWRVSQ